VEELDLSSNLICDWGIVIEILKQLPKLQVLNLSENRLGSLKQLKISNTFKNVKVLVMNKIGASWDEVK
jgi:Leucine-rich repeat (LRR) protein